MHGAIKVFAAVNTVPLPVGLRFDVIARFSGTSLRPSLHRHVPDSTPCKMAPTSVAHLQFAARSHHCYTHTLCSSLVLSIPSLGVRRQSTVLFDVFNPSLMSIYQRIERRFSRSSKIGGMYTKYLLPSSQRTISLLTKSQDLKSGRWVYYSMHGTFHGK